LDKLLEYKRNWIQHVNRMPRNKLPRVVKHYSSSGWRNHGRPLKRLLNTWDRNGSTSGPNPWQMYDNDNDKLHVFDFTHLFRIYFTFHQLKLIWCSYILYYAYTRKCHTKLFFWNPFSQPNCKISALTNARVTKSFRYKAILVFLWDFAF
jgi:hypothetical protein